MAESTVGSRIRDLRRDKGWSQAELADKLGVTGAVVSKWETGTGSPGLESVSVMADLFGVSVDYLIKGREQETRTVFISQIEYYAKTDDPSKAGELNISFRDEKGKSVAAYIQKYRSVRLFAALCEKNPSFVLEFPIGEAVWFALASGRTGIFANRLNMPFLIPAGRTSVPGTDDYRKVYCTLDAVTEWNIFQYREGILAPQATNKEAMRQTLQEYMRNNSWGRLTSRAEGYTGQPKKFLMNLFPEEEAQFMEEDDLRRALCVLPNEIFRTICSDRVTDSTRNTLFGPQDFRESVWYGAYPYLIHEAFALGRYDLVDDLLNRAEKNNELGLKKREAARQSAQAQSVRPSGTMVDLYGESKQHYLASLTFLFAANQVALNRARTEAKKKLVPPAQEFGFVRILEKTIRLAVGKGKLKYFERFTDLNNKIRELFPKTYVPDSDLISVARYAADPDTDQDALKLAICVHNGVLDISEICQYNDMPLLRKALEKYPLCPEEIVLKENRRRLDSVMKGEWREIFRSAVDSGDTKLAKAVITGRAEPAKTILDEQYRKLNEAGLVASINGDWLTERNPADILAYTEQRRKELIGEAVKSEKRENVPETDGKSPEDADADMAFLRRWKTEDKAYFKRLIKAGGKEDAALRLCQKLEAYFRHKGLSSRLKLKGMEDTFQNMIDLYYGYDAPEEDVASRYYRNLMHRLRMYRNKVVHEGYGGDAREGEMSDQKLLECADYICDLPL